MTTLQTRLAQADKPTRELLEEVFCACFPVSMCWDFDEADAYYHREQRWDAMLDAEAWTSAVEMLVPEGWIVETTRAFDDDGEYFSTVTLTDSFSVGRGCDPEDARAVTVRMGAKKQFSDPTALALAIACLKARGL